MLAVKIGAVLLLGYLSGSVSYAIIVGHLVAKKDIRQIGNQNAGTMNVLRNVGRQWGILVGVLDGLKSLLPMILAFRIWFTEASSLHFFIILSVGLAALVGHWKPVFHGFKGGRGVGCIIGIYLFVVPFEFLFSFVFGGLLVVFFLRNVRFRYGRWVPIMFILLTPVFALISSFLLDLQVTSQYSLGGHPWYTIVGTFITSLSMLLINLTFMGTRVDELKGEETND